MRKVQRTTGQQKRCMGLWLILLGSLFGIAIVAGKGVQIQSVVIAFGFVISFFLIFLNKKFMTRLKDGELDELQHAITDYSVAFLFLVMFFIVSPFFVMFQVNAGWALVLLLMGVHYLILSLVHGKSMLFLGGLVIADGIMMFVWRTPPIWVWLSIYAGLLASFGTFLLCVKKKEQV